MPAATTNCILLSLLALIAGGATLRLHALQPQTPAELLFFSTVRLEARNSTSESVGTGFFFYFESSPEQLLIITNKHVLEGATTVECLLHEGDDNKPLATYKRVRWTPPPPSSPGARIDHPTHEVDIAVLPFSDTSGLRTNAAWQLLENPHPQHGVFLRAVTDAQILSNPDLVEKLSAVEQVLLYGYPNGLWDVANNLPIARMGLTASAPSVDYLPPPGVGIGEHGNRTAMQLRGAIGLLDASCDPGSSGSAVVFTDLGVQTDRYGNVRVGGPRRLFLLGIVFGSIRRNQGVLMTIQIETQPDMGITLPYEEDVRLCLYFKATEILALRPLISARPSK